MSFKLRDWSTRRVDAINKLSKKRGYPCNDTNPFFDEYIAIQNSYAKTKREYKEERRKNAVDNHFKSVVRKWLCV
tara:strand:+ start:255 stop:479 length:225 start_codon:yes stop_codon:yes gene_type:complete